MKELLTEIVTKIETDVTEASEWVIHQKQPVWTDQHDGRVLYVYLDSDRVSDQFRTTGSAEIVYRIALEYAEPADLEAGQLAKGEEVSLDLLDQRKALMQWAFANQFLDNAWRFDFIGTSYTNPRRPLDLQGFVCLVDAYQREEYA